MFPSLQEDRREVGTRTVPLTSTWRRSRRRIDQELFAQRDQSRLTRELVRKTLTRVSLWWKERESEGP